MMAMAGLTSTEVNKAVMSFDVTTSPGSRLTLWMKSTNCWVFLMWWGD